MFRKILAAPEIAEVNVDSLTRLKSHKAVLDRKIMLCYRPDQYRVPDC
jgi:hypothetical protein